MKYDPTRYYIFNCLGELVCNPKGYKTMAAAEAQATRKHWELYQLALRFETRLINRIALGSTL